MSRSWRARTPRPIWFNDSHEAEARKAQLEKQPNRFGAWVLRRLGFRGDIGNQGTRLQARHSHEHPVRRSPSR